MKTIKIKTYKNPHKLHYEWEGKLIEETEDYIMVTCLPGRELNHYTKNKVFNIQNHSIEIFMKKEWFTVAASVEGGKIVSYYCNIAKPSTFDGEIVEFVDLDLDYVKRKYEDWKTVDEDEFQENQLLYEYGEELVKQTKKALEILKEKVDKKLFPFDGFIEQIIEEEKHMVI
jgi:hypothetical protein